ncbi:hypothetical protein M8494_21815 [Serratia ureilytica]
MAPALQSWWRCCWRCCSPASCSPGGAGATLRPLRPHTAPLSWGGYLLASALAIYPVAFVLMLIDIAIQDKSQRAEERWNRRSYRDARRSQTARESR